MQKSFFDRELIKNVRKITCPSCDTRFLIPVSEIEVTCEECGQEFMPRLEPEDFVWHPSEKY